MQPEKSSREHLFISYASEDFALAEWLTLRLAAEGYKVWCDKIKLLGGESYPKDIREAIKTSTFRQLALMSAFSVSKDNPIKERVIGMNVGKTLNIKGFIIPINVDGIEPVNLDLVTTDLTYIPFFKSWVQGLSQLLKKLSQVGAPKEFKEGMHAVTRWADTEQSLANRKETLWSNVIPIEEMPEMITHYYVPDRNDLDSLESEWAFARQDSHNAWSFRPPSTQRAVTLQEREKVNWKEVMYVGNIRTFDIVSNLLNQILRLHCLRKGMHITADGSDVYFPKDLVPNDKLYFKRFDGEKVYVKTVGEITFRTSTGQNEKSKYYLAPFFTPLLARFGYPTYQVNLRIRWTDLKGVEYPRGMSLRRRKRLTRNWYNYQWLSRITAFASWLTDGQDSATITDGSNAIRISRKPINIQSPLGIDESALYPKEEEEEQEVELAGNDVDEDGEDDEEEAEEGASSSTATNDTENVKRGR